MKNRVGGMALNLQEWDNRITMKKFEEIMIKGMEQEIQEEWVKFDKSIYKIFRFIKI